VAIASRLARGLAQSLLVLLVSLALCELVIRALGETDGDGQFRLLGSPLRPFRIPFTAIGEAVARYRAADDAFLLYDPVLGWAPRPGGRSRDGLAHANGAGLRAERETPPIAPPGSVRIAIFGDSFTFGDEVALEETWGLDLERVLRGEGFDADVLNFGVNAYGVDQAYLRWHEQGRATHPDVVILGFQPEDALRDQNVFRPLYFAGTNVPLSKPRFVLDGEELRLVNSPTLRPDEMVPALAGIATHPLRPYERFLDARYDQAWWQRSKLAAFLVALANGDNAPGAAGTFRLDPEARDLARRIVERFAAEVEASGARFLVVHLPRREDFDARAEGRALWYAELLDALAVEYPVVEIGVDVKPLREDDFTPHGHYGARLNQLVAAALAPPVVAALCHEGTGRPPPTACPR
jgi:hypothetical protein